MSSEHLTRLTLPAQGRPPLHRFIDRHARNASKARQIGVAAPRRTQQLPRNPLPEGMFSAMRQLPAGVFQNHVEIGRRSIVKCFMAFSAMPLCPA
jgi:hypothetical protein